MADASPPESLSVPMKGLVGLGVEYWRLSQWLEQNPSAGSAPARHALRRLDDFLRECELEVRGMDGRPFDPGLAVRVVDTIDDPAMPDGQAVIAETMAPMILWRGQVVKPADVVVKRKG
ncbi:MAG: hypothetical protein JWN51_1406 [Phycisphaerales bacterium]|jgi:hypothetical protein|nr:hypothetical protein [Phycisphaerales bacterium]